MSSYTIPYVTTQTNRGERTVDVYSRLLADRIIYLGTPIDDGVANTVIAQLIHLESENPDAPINLYLNSPGGSIPAMLAIYDAMQFVRAGRRDDVRRAGGGDRRRAAGRRRARDAADPAARRGSCIHAPAARGRGAIPDLILEADEVERVRSLLEQILAGHTGRTPEQVREDTERELVLTADAAPSTTASSTA